MQLIFIAARTANRSSWSTARRANVRALLPKQLRKELSCASIREIALESNEDYFVDLSHNFLYK